MGSGALSKNVSPIWKKTSFIAKSSLLEAFISASKISQEQKAIGLFLYPQQPESVYSLRHLSAK